MRAMREMGKFSFLQTSPAEVTETTVLDVTDVGYRSWFCKGCFFFSSLFPPPLWSVYDHFDFWGLLHDYAVSVFLAKSTNEGSDRVDTKSFLR